MNNNIASNSSPYLIWLFPGYLGGELDAATWLDVTRELRKMGWRVELVCVGAGGKQTIQGVEVITIQRPEKYLIRHLVFHFRAIQLILKDWNSIHAILFHPISLLWLTPLKLKKRPGNKRFPLFVMDTRTVPMEDMSRASWKDRLRGGFTNAMNRVANRWADGQTVITPRMAEVLNVTKGKLWGIWPSGVDLDEFIPAQAMRHWPSEGEPIHLIYPGALSRERNIPTLCRAVEKANAQGMEFILTLIGNGTEKQNLEKFASTTGGRVRVLPPVPHDQVPDWLAKAHIGVLPFPEEEKFAVSSHIKLFEYLGAGLAILATRTVGHCHVMEDGKYVFWAENSDEEGLVNALRNAWKNRTALREMGQAAARDADRWTWHASAMKLDAALKHGMGEG
ncbi:MAG: glycosyltransferase [Omnitrophica WOR_2 bacterium]